MSRDPLLQEREQTHGDYAEVSDLSQELKRLFRSRGGWSALNVSQKEAIEMICVKLSRIMSGQPNFKDHWDDIAGYAKLGSEACRAG
jgi:hypothetical protein